MFSGLCMMVYDFEIKRNDSFKSFFSVFLLCVRGKKNENKKLSHWQTDKCIRKCPKKIAPNFYDRHISLGKIYHKWKCTQLLTPFSGRVFMPFHMVWYILFEVLAFKTIEKIGCRRITTSQKAISGTNKWKK